MNEEKLKEIREVVNQQSKVIKHLMKEITMMKFVLGYEEKKGNLDVFFKTLESQGISMEDAMKKPELLNQVLKYVRR